MINSHALLFMLGGIFMTHEQFEKAADYWKNKGITAMPKEELKKAVEEYIAANNTCALATGTGDYVRCTPIEYSYQRDNSNEYQKRANFPENIEFSGISLYSDKSIRHRKNTRNFNGN